MKDSQTFVLYGRVGAWPARVMNGMLLSETIRRMEAAFELTGKYLQRVSGNSIPFMTLRVNGTAVIKWLYNRLLAPL